MTPLLPAILSAMHAIIVTVVAEGASPPLATIAASCARTVYVYVCMYTYMCVRKKSMCVSIYVYVYIYIYIYIYALA